MNPRNCSPPLALFATRLPTRFGSRLATILTVIAIFSVFGGGTARAQEGTVVEPAAQPRSALSDPRLRNMLRSVKDESAAAIGEIAKDPEDAVRNATRLFQEKKDQIDPENIEAVAEKIQSAVAAVQVPATRPAPGISGGEPTPVAMPVNPDEIPVPETEKVDPPDLPSATSIVQENNISTIPGVPPTTPMIPDSPGLTPGEVPAPTPLTRKYEPGGSGGFPSAGKNQIEIESDESVLDSARGVLLITGNVKVSSTSPEFQIKCDKIEIHVAEGFGMDAVKGKPSDIPFKRATASGGMVEIKRTTVDENGKRKTQIAIARSLDYNVATEDIVLSGGPPYIQDGDRFIKTISEDAKIIMRGNGKYEITGNRSQIVIPIPNNKDGKKGDGVLGGAFTSPFEGIR